MFTLSKEDIKVVPTEMYDVSATGKPVKYFMFVEKGDKKNFGRPIYKNTFVYVDEPTCGFYKCAYMIEDIRKTAYVSYDGQLIGDEKQVELIDKYMKIANEIKNSETDFEKCKSRIETEFEQLKINLRKANAAKLDREKIKNI